MALPLDIELLRHYTSYMSNPEKPATININVRFPPELAAQIKQAAQEEGRSINSEILWALRDYLARRRRKHPNPC